MTHRSLSVVVNGLKVGQKLNQWSLEQYEQRLLLPCFWRKGITSLVWILKQTVAVCEVGSRDGECLLLSPPPPVSRAVVALVKV